MMNVLKWIALSFILVGAINWGLVGAFDFNLVSYLFGDMSYISRVIYLLVAFCALIYLVFSIRENSSCSHYNC